MALLAAALTLGAAASTSAQSSHTFSPPSSDPRSHAMEPPRTVYSQPSFDELPEEVLSFVQSMAFTLPSRAGAIASRRSLLQADDEPAAAETLEEDTSVGEEPPPIPAPLAEPGILAPDAETPPEEAGPDENAGILVPPPVTQSLDMLCETYTNGTATPFVCDVQPFEINSTTTFFVRPLPSLVLVVPGTAVCRKVRCRDSPNLSTCMS